MFWCSVVEIANLEEEIKNMEEVIESDKEEHKAVMKQKATEYEETEKELTANNQEICMPLTHCSHCFVAVNI